MQTLTTAESLTLAVHELVDRYRDMCLWFLRPDYYPATQAETLRVLKYIQRHGDREAHLKAGELQQWLLQHSSAMSAGS